MRWTFRILGALAFAWLIFLASPFVALHNFAREVETRDVEAIRERVNFRALRVSLLKQMLRLAAEDKAGRALDPSERQLAIDVATSLAEPLAIQLLTPEALLDLLNGTSSALQPEDDGAIESAPVSVARHLRLRSLDAAWRLFRNSEMHGFRNIVVSLPPDRPPDRQFRLRLRLVRSTWKLVNLELPPALLRTLSRKLSTHTRQGRAPELRLLPHS